MTHDDLLACLGAVPPFEPEGVRLLRQSCSTGGWFPAADRETLIAATTELIAYTERCRDALHNLSNLQPVPLNIPLMEFSL